MALRRYAAFAWLTILSSGSAGAADLGGWTAPPYVAPQYSMPALMWSGVYLGLNAGYSSSHDFTREVSAIPYDGMGLEHFGSSASGFTGGGQIGYNYQTGHLVVGLEADFNYADLSRVVTSPFGTVTADVSGGFVGTVRPRLGLAWGPWLFYGTGGLAYANVNTIITGNTGNNLTASNSDWRLGWAAGGGLEYALGRNWSMRAEYMHIDLGRVDFSGVALDTNTYAWHDHLTDNVLRLGINYRF
jgi:outer membrane immunogenic protein